MSNRGEEYGKRRIINIRKEKKKKKKEKEKQSRAWVAAGMELG